MMKGKVRQGFVLHLNNKVYREGQEIELTLSEFERVSGILEPVLEPQPKKSSSKTEKDD